MLYVPCVRKVTGLVFLPMLFLFYIWRVVFLLLFFHLAVPIGSEFLTSHGRHLGKIRRSKQTSLRTVLLKMPAGHSCCIVCTCTFPKCRTVCIETLRHRSEPIVCRSTFPKCQTACVETLRHRSEAMGIFSHGKFGPVSPN